MTQRERGVWGSTLSVMLNHAHRFRGIAKTDDEKRARVVPTVDPGASFVELAIRASQGDDSWCTRERLAAMVGT